MLILVILNFLDATNLRSMLRRTTTYHINGEGVDDPIQRRWMISWPKIKRHNSASSSKFQPEASSCEGALLSAENPRPEPIGKEKNVDSTRSTPWINYGQLMDYIDSWLLTNGTSDITCTYLSKKAQMVRTFENSTGLGGVTLSSVFTFPSYNAQLSMFEAKHFGADYDETFSMISLDETHRITTSRFYCEMCDKYFEEEGPVAFEKYPKKYAQIETKDEETEIVGDEPHSPSSKEEMDRSITKDKGKYFFGQ